MAKTSSAGQREEQLICTPLARDCAAAGLTSRGTGMRWRDWLPEVWATAEAEGRTERANRAAAKRGYCISITVNELGETWEHRDPNSVWQRRPEMLQDCEKVTI